MASTLVKSYLLPKTLCSGLRHLNVTLDAYLAVPKITPQLRSMTRALRGADIRRRKAQGIVLDEDGRILPAVEAEQPPLRIPGADIVRSWPSYLESSDDASCRAVLLAYHTCAYAHRRSLPIEAFCCAANVTTQHVLEQLVLLAVRQGAQAATMLTGLNQPRVVQKTIEMALRDEGVSDRALFHRASGWTPTPKSAQTNITVTQSAQVAATAQAVAVPAPPPESTIRRLSDRFNEAPRLVAPAPNVPIADAEVVDEDEETD